MRALIEVASDSGIVTLGDAGAALPAGLDQAVLLKHLEPLARSGGIFFLVTDDPVQFRVELFAGEPPPPAYARDFEGLGGAFRLEAPSGRVALGGWDKEGNPGEIGGLEVSPGPYLLSVLARRPFDGERHGEDMSELLGADWTFKQKVDRLGLLGCLPLALTAISILTGRWHWLWYVLPLLAISWLPFAVLKLTRRYKAAEQRALEHERARPHYVLSLTPTQQDGLPGGFVRI